MSDKTIGVGVIGVGQMGRRHSLNLAKRIAGANLVALMDIDADRLGSVASECGVEKTFTDPHALIADPEVQAVIITSLDKTHAEFTLACLEAGKPVLCEKPLATNAEDGERVFRVEIAKGGRMVQVGFMREYDSAHRKVKAVLDSGEIGPPLLFRGFHYNSRMEEERHIDDVIVNSAIHDIHSAHWLMGQEIVKVYVGHIPFAPDKPETCRLLVVHLTFRNGGLGIIQVNSESGYGYEVDVEITAESGQVTTRSLTSPDVRHSGTLRRVIEQDWEDRFETAYLTEMQSWTSGVLSGKLDGPSAWDGYTSLVVADACKRSFRSGNPEAVPVVPRPDFYPVR